MKYRIVKVFDSDRERFVYECQVKLFFWTTKNWCSSYEEAIEFMNNLMQRKKIMWEEEVK